MADHQDSGLDNGLDAARHAHAALELHGIDIGLFEEPAGILHGLLIAGLIG